MKLRFQKSEQTMLADEFRRRSLPPPTKTPARRKVRTYAVDVPAGTRHTDDPWRQGEKTAAVDRLMADGMSKADAYQKVGW